MYLNDWLLMTDLEKLDYIRNLVWLVRKYTSSQPDDVILDNLGHFMDYNKQFMMMAENELILQRFN